MNYINQAHIEKILSNSIIKIDEFMEGLEKHNINKKEGYLYKDVQERYNKMTTEYYVNL